jgi:cysteinyl-tRNA synthetase
LNHHYRAPLDFSFHELEIAQKNYQKLCKLFDAVSVDGLTADAIKNDSYVARMLEFLHDDVNTTGAIGVLFEYVKNASHNTASAPAIKAFLMSVFGLRLQPLPEENVEHTPEIMALLEERNQARAAKDWAKADALRDKLQALGVEVQDKK